MSIFNVMERDSLAIENAEHFIKPIEKLVYFQVKLGIFR